VKKDVSRLEKSKDDFSSVNIFYTKITVPPQVACLEEKE